jgi:hypothetical protein
MAEWSREHGWLLAALSIVMALVAIASTIVAAVVMRADYFVRKRTSSHNGWPPWLRQSLRAGKIALGVILLLLGIVLSLPLVPGPGIVLLLVGLSLVEFPGKRTLEARLVGMPGVLSKVNAIRRRFGRAPLQMPARRAEA